MSTFQQAPLALRPSYTSSPFSTARLPGSLVLSSSSGPPVTFQVAMVKDPGSGLVHHFGTYSDPSTDRGLQPGDKVDMKVRPPPRTPPSPTPSNPPHPLFHRWTK